MRNILSRLAVGALRGITKEAEKVIKEVEDALTSPPEVKVQCTCRPIYRNGKRIGRIRDYCHCPIHQFSTISTQCVKCDENYGREPEDNPPFICPNCK